MTPEAPVIRQLDAYNARDLATFVAQFSDDIKVYMPPSATPALAGKTEFAEHYRTKRFNLPNLEAKILNRMIVGNKVIDHERVSGVTETPSEVAVVYEVENDLIINVWFYSE